MDLSDKERDEYLSLTHEGRAQYVAARVVSVLREGKGKTGGPSLKEAWAMNAAFVRLDGEGAETEAHLVFCTVLSAILDMMVQVLPKPNEMVTADVLLAFLKALGSAAPTLLSILPADLRENVIAEMVGTMWSGTEMVEATLMKIGAGPVVFVIDSTTLKH